METYEIPIYTEHCACQGLTVSDAAYRESPDSDDWLVYTGTADELLAEAEEIDNRPNCSPYYGKVARSIREFIYRDRPDLRPVESDDDE